MLSYGRIVDKPVTEAECIESPDSTLDIQTADRVI
jgi:hypothetical protein